jgi:hypothetical protein
MIITKMEITFTKLVILKVMFLMKANNICELQYYRCWHSPCFITPMRNQMARHVDLLHNILCPIGNVLHSPEQRNT